MTPPPPMTTVAQTPLLVGICGGRGLGDRVVDRRPNALGVGNRLRRMARSARPGMAKSLGAQPERRIRNASQVVTASTIVPIDSTMSVVGTSSVPSCSNIPKSPTVSASTNASNVPAMNSRPRTLARGTNRAARRSSRSPGRRLQWH